MVYPHYNYDVPFTTESPNDEYFKIIPRFQLFPASVVGPAVLG
jgi:hypothetical protein